MSPRSYLSLVKFSHSIFALPFALSGAWLAAGRRPDWAALGWIVFCAVAARTAAMGFNRLVDRHLDARNPRTQVRELPSGVLSVRAVGTLVSLACAAFVAGAFALGPLPGMLSFPVLLVLLGYSYFKRFSWLAHAVLGLALALAPLGAWIAVRGTLDGPLAPVLWMALGVWSWVTGFDLIYACQDAEHDREQGLFSVPARFGIARALWISAGLHVVTVVALALVGVTAGLTWVYAAALAVTAGMLVWEHRLVKPHDLSRVNVAFFTINGWIGVLLFLGLAFDPGLGPLT